MDSDGVREHYYFTFFDCHFLLMVRQEEKRVEKGRLHTYECTIFMFNWTPFVLSQLKINGDSRKGGERKNFLSEK